MKATGIAIAVLGATLLFSGCASTRSTASSWTDDSSSLVERTANSVFEHDALIRVKPWERDLLSREDMAWAPDPMRAARRSHINFSKEASLIGGSAGGGGCGCN